MISSHIAFLAGRRGIHGVRSVNAAFRRTKNLHDDNADIDDRRMKLTPTIRNESSQYTAHVATRCTLSHNECYSAFGEQRLSYILLARIIIAKFISQWRYYMYFDVPIHQANICMAAVACSRKRTKTTLGIDLVISVLQRVTVTAGDLITRNP